MNDTSHMVRTSYYAFYRQYYAPQLMQIDMLLKTMEEPITAADAALALQMTEDSVRRVMERESVTTLDKDGFLAVMRHGESEICHLYQRECTHNIKKRYGPSDIAYIYGLLDEAVRAAFKKMGVAEIPARDVPRLLDRVSVFLLF